MSALAKTCAALLLGAALALDLSRCVPVQPPAPTPAPTTTVEGGSGDVYDRACAELAALGCPEATVNCATTMRDDDRHRTTTIHAACIAGASSVDQVRTCGPYARCSK